MANFDEEVYEDFTIRQNLNGAAQLYCRICPKTGSGPDVGAFVCNIITPVKVSDLLIAIENHIRAKD